MTAPLAQIGNPAAQARAALRIGRLDEARKHFAAAVTQRPRDPMILIEAAVVEGQLGDLRSAERLLEKALKLDPLNADAWYNLAQVAREKDQIERAARLFRKALELDPQYADAAFGLGEALYAQGKAEDALPWLDRAARQAPNDAEILHVKALSLDHLGRSVEAVAAFREVLRLKPDHINCALNLAALAARTADPLESLALIEAVEAKAGVPPAGYAMAAQVLHLAGENERASAYAEKAIAAGLHVAQALTVRANILIDGGDFDEGEAELKKVLQLRKDSPGAHYRLAVIKRLPPEAEQTLLRRARDGSVSATARSVSYFALYHLYDQMAAYGRAFEMLAEANALKGGQAPFDERRHQAQAARVMATYSPQLIAEKRTQGFDRAGPVFVFGMPRSGTTLTEQILAAHPDVYPGGERRDVQRAVKDIEGWPEAAVDLPAEKVQELGRQIHDSMFSAAADRPFATDKMPGNYLLVGAIACMLPQAKLVYVRRSPGDNALSLYEQNFLRGLNYSYDLAKIGFVYRHHQALMQHWIETCALPIHIVDYDLLVQDPESHIRRLLDFVGLDFRPECLAPHQVVRSIRTSSVWQVRQPISANSVGRWRRYEKQFEPFFRALEGGA